MSISLDGSESSYCIPRTGGGCRRPVARFPAWVDPKIFPPDAWRSRSGWSQFLVCRQPFHNPIMSGLPVTRAESRLADNIYIVRRLYFSPSTT